MTADSTADLPVQFDKVRGRIKNKGGWDSRDSLRSNCKTKACKALRQDAMKQENLKSDLGNPPSFGKRKVQIKYPVGQRFLFDDKEYILSKIDKSGFAVINLETGNRWRNSMWFSTEEDECLSVDDLRTLVGKEFFADFSVIGPGESSARYEAFDRLSDDWHIKVQRISILEQRLKDADLAWRAEVDDNSRLVDENERLLGEVASLSGTLEDRQRQLDLCSPPPALVWDRITGEGPWVRVVNKEEDERKGESHLWGPRTRVYAGSWAHNQDNMDRGQRSLWVYPESLTTQEPPQGSLRDDLVGKALLLFSFIGIFGSLGHLIWAFA